MQLVERGRQEIPLVGEILTRQQTVKLIGQPHPLKSARVVRDLPAGLSIAEMLDAVQVETQLPHALWVYVGDWQVPPERWRYVRPKAGTVVSFKAALHGAGTTRQLVGLAIAIAALVVAGPIGEALAGTAIIGALGLSAATLSSAVAGGIAPGGRPAFDALFPKDHS